MHITDDKINEIHRLGWGEEWSERRIANALGLDRGTVHKYLHNPYRVPVTRSRTSKLDPYKELIYDLVQRDPKVTSAILLRHLRSIGYTGGRTIIGDYLRTIRPRRKKRAFVRIEVSPGDRFEVDWGHFGALDYDGDPRKLYAFAMIECHSRKLFVEFTHSQNFETFVRCHMNGFRYFEGIAREIAYDNLLSVVAERDGNIIRFNPRFLAFTRQMCFFPRPCHVAAGWEKGKIERGIGYMRQNFFPLRTFTDLADANHQVRQWLDEVANKRIHSTTRQKPDERFQKEALQPLPKSFPDYRETVHPKVYKDMRLSFDGNRYCVPHRFVGARVILKADSYRITIYDRHREIVTYPRCWQRGQDIGAELFEKDLLKHLPTAKRSHDQQRLIALLGADVQLYLRGLAQTNRSLAKQISELLTLVRNFGPDAVRSAIEKAQNLNAYGTDYITNILHQQHSPRDIQPPLVLKDPRLNTLATEPVSLLHYDSFILQHRKEDI
jgi:transposase